jgi:hypothetical protein
LFDSPAAISQVAQDAGADLTGTSLFFYEIHEQEFDGSKWVPFGPEPAFATNVERPAAAIPAGCDVVTFSARTAPECSPLSCNSLASTVEVNRHCLLPSFDRAKQLLEAGVFANSEPGPYRIFAVHALEWSDAAR